jgi:hypothetical protein
MDRIFRSTRCCVPLILVAVIVAGPLLTNALVAQPQPNPPPPLPVAEQNRDANGLIRVHEQGTANVNVTSGSLKVGGAVSVTNFPATQNVFVTGGTLTGLTPVAQVFQYGVNLQPGQSSQIAFNTTLNAVFVSAGSLREGGVSLYSPLTNGVVFGLSLGQNGAGGSDVQSFAHPVPLSAATFDCSANAADLCLIGLTIMTP